MLLKTSSIDSQNKLGKIIQFPLTRIFLAILLVILGVIAAQLTIGLLSKSLAMTPVVSILSILIALFCVYFSYWLYVRWIEKRRLAELSANGAVQELTIGLLIGFGIIATVIGTLSMLGSYQIRGKNSWWVLLPAAVANIPSGFVQEILFRGIILRNFEERMDTWIALAISAVLFGLIHVFSANATVLSTLSIMLEGGILLAAAYLLTKRLWLAIGIHITWDLSIDGIFGIGMSAISGKSIPGLLQARLVGSDLLTGSNHGVEGSLVTFVIALMAGCILTWLALRTKHLLNSD